MTAFVWEKKGRIFNPSEHQENFWMKEFAQAPATLVFDEFIRVYFSTRPFPDEKGQYVSYSAFIDLDRKNLNQIIRIANNPIMKLGSLGEFDEFGIYPVSMIRHENKVLAYYGGWTRCESIPFTVSIGLAESNDDGVTFEKIGPGPLLTNNYQDPYVLSGPKIRKFDEKWYLWYVAGTKWHQHDQRVEAVYKIRMATSNDGINWLRTGQNIIADELELDECQASPDVIYMNQKYHMFFCYKYGLDFRGNSRGYRIGYAYSHDLIQWHRDDDLAGLECSGDGWDSTTVSYPHVFEVDGQCYMLYLGNDFGKHGFGLAKLELK